MTQRPPMGVEGVARGLSGLPGPLADETPEGRRMREEQDLELAGLPLVPEPPDPHVPVQAGRWARLRRRLGR